MRGGLRQAARGFARLASIFLGVTGCAHAAAATAFLEGEVVSDTGARISGLQIALHSGAATSSTTGNGGLFVLDGLFVGGREQLRVTGEAFEGYIGPRLYVGTTSLLDRRFTSVESPSLTAWATEFDADGTLDPAFGIVFGAVLDAAGSPVSGAVLSMSPSDGDVFYFDDAGAPDRTAVATGATGRYVVLNVPPGPINVCAEPGSTAAGSTAVRPAGACDPQAPPTIAVASGRTLADTIAGLDLRPPGTLAGVTRDEAGAAVGGAAIVWEADTAVATAADGAGAYSLKGITEGLDATLRATAPGYRTALTFRRSLSEIDDPGAVAVAFLSDAAYASYPVAFGEVQTPSQGMIIGRVLKEDGSPLAGAVVTAEPDVGTARYFGPGGAPDPALLQTSASGLFALFNVPVGNVVLSAVGPGETIRSEVAPSEMFAVTRGELQGLGRITVSGRVRNEFAETDDLDGAIVNLVEYPYVATITDSVGRYTLAGVPAGELVTFKASRSEFKDSTSFVERAPLADLACLDNQDGDGTDGDRSDCKDLFAIRSLAYSDLHAQLGLSPNRNLGFVGASVLLSSGSGAAGLQARLSPSSGNINFLEDGIFEPTSITTIGSLEILNSSPSIAGLVISDTRTGFAQMSLVRVAADTVALDTNIPIECDTGSDGTFANIYPCNDTVLSAPARDMIFHFDRGDNLRVQVQLSTDPNFTTISMTSAKKGKKFLRTSFWFAKKKAFKKIKSIGPPGTAVYWRVLAEATGDEEPVTTTPFVLHLP